MKIRLVSINGKLNDPIYNESLMEEATEKALEDGIELLVFPSNSLSGVSIGEIRNNEAYRAALHKAEKNFFIFSTEVMNKNNISICFDCSNQIVNGISFEIRSYAEPVQIDHFFETREEVLEPMDGTFRIVCQGKGTESTCKCVYSNLKMVIYNNKIVASNLKDNADILDFDTTDILTKYPYLENISNLDEMFKKILDIQADGLYGKMKSMNRYKICLGVSGGLDSTVSLLVCVEAFKKYGLPLSDILGVTMPGLGTTERTYKNALTLMKELGISIEDIDLRPLLKTHLVNISQPEGKFDVTFEQTQSRERTQVLLDIANRDNSIMIGTGCMSEFALGWMSYGGDHLSMYAINIGLPKTVVKMYAKWFIDRTYPSLLSETIKDILEGPVSPELLPIDDKGQQHEKTESIIGDYAVQDFFIYYMVKENISIHRLFCLAKAAFPEYEPKQLLKWLKIFTTRFFTRQFKKNCYGDGLQIFSYSVSPFTGFEMASDIGNDLWAREIEELEKELETEE